VDNAAASETISGEYSVIAVDVKGSFGGDHHGGRERGAKKA
jgi:hypothetical protein